MKECPTCHRPFGAEKRICFACRRPIARNHKWHIEGCYVLHDDCQNPTIRALVRPPQLEMTADVPPATQAQLAGTAAEEEPR